MGENDQPIVVLFTCNTYNFSVGQACTLCSLSCALFVTVSVGGIIPKISCIIVITGQPFLRRLYDQHCYEKGPRNGLINFKLDNIIKDANRVWERIKFVNRGIRPTDGLYICEDKP